MTTKPASFKENEPARKPYETPRLEVYGDIRAVTDSVGMTGNLDGGAGHGQTKTR
jgi:hypothetical protein